MKPLELLITVRDIGDRRVSANPDATIAELVDSLTSTSQQVLTVIRSGQVLERDQLLSESDLRSGDTVKIQSRADATGALKGHSPVSLKVLEGPAAGESFDITYGDTSIGRVVANDITIIDPALSRTHATIRVERSFMSISDAGSTNGTWLAGNPIQTSALRSGDRVMMGQTVFEVIGRNDQPLAITATMEIPVTAAGLEDLNPKVDINGNITATITTGEIIDNETETDTVPQFYRRSRSLNRYEGRVITLPTPPTRPSKWRMWGAAIERFDRKAADFVQALHESEKILTAELSLERERRLHESVSISEIAKHVGAADERLWERELDDYDALKFRVGLVDQAPRSKVELPVLQPSPEADRVLRLAARFETVSAVPAVGDLGNGLRVVGSPDITAELASSILLQLAGLHCPDDLIIAALIGDCDTKKWDWLKWLPHCRDGSQKLGSELLAASSKLSQHLTQTIVEQIIQRSRRLQLDPTASLGSAIVLLVDEGAQFEPEALDLILQKGPVLGIHLLWLASDSPLLSDPLGTTITIDSNSSATETTGAIVSGGESIHGIALELCDRKSAGQIARGMAPIVDRSGRFGWSGSLLAIEELFTDDASIEGFHKRWAVPMVSLRIPLGKTPHGQLSLDLVSDGPHAVIAGDQGSGRTSLLETWAASLAMSYAPESVELFLVGSSSGGTGLLSNLASLPHVVGSLMSPQHSSAAIAQLREATRLRAETLATDNSGTGKDLAGMARMVLLIDDIDVWSAQAPEFIAGLAELLPQWAELGMHLVSTTSSWPELSDPLADICQAAALRIGLRLADPAVAQSVVSSHVPLDIERRLPGFGVIRWAENRSIMFKAASLRHSSLCQGSEVVVSEFGFVEPTISLIAGDDDSDMVLDLVNVTVDAAEAVTV